MTPPSSDEGGPLPSATKPHMRTNWRLSWRGRDIALPESTLIVGRAPTCNLVLDRPAVSRTHARFVVTASGVTVEDLGSSNGVYVNGERVRDLRPVFHGDHILFGTEQVVLINAKVTPGVGELTRPSSPTPEPPPRREARQNMLQTTQKADAFQTLGRLAERMLGMGRYDAATKILTDHMRGLQAGIRAGDPVPDEVITGSTHYALKLAAAQGDGGWVDYVIDIHLSLRRPLPVDAIEPLGALVRGGIRIDRALFGRYQQALREVATAGGPDQHALESIIALKLP